MSDRENVPRPEDSEAPDESRIENRPLANLVLVFVSVVVALVAAEIAVRALASPEYHRKRYQFNFHVFQWDERHTRFDSELGFLTRPNLEGVFENVEFSTRFRTNEWGFRDDEESLVDPDVLILGDSFGFGWGVEEDESAAALLEELSGVKVLNMSVSGYGTVQQYLLLKRYGDQADVRDAEVVVLFYLNDRLENRSPPGGMFPAVRREGSEVLFIDPVEEAVLDCIRSHTPNWATALSQRSTILDLLLNRFWNTRKEWQGRMHEQFVNHQEANRDLPGVALDEFEVFDEVLGLMVEYCRGRDLGLNFVLVPFLGYYLGDRVSPPYPEEVEILGDWEIRYVNPYDRFDAQDYYPLDGHFNREGQRKLAQVVSEMLHARDD